MIIMLLIVIIGLFFEIFLKSLFNIIQKGYGQEWGAWPGLWKQRAVYRALRAVSVKPMPGAPNQSGS